MKTEDFDQAVFFNEKNFNSRTSRIKNWKSNGRLTALSREFSMFKTFQIVIVLVHINR